MILNDSEIEARAIFDRLIEPFEPMQVKEQNEYDEVTNIVSYGLSSFGYDLRLDRQFKVYRKQQSYIDVKLDMTRDYIEVDPEIDGFGQEYIYIEPGTFLLGQTMEYIRMPRDLCGDVIGKSTYARCGIYLNVTPIEPGWEGRITLELGNMEKVPVKLYVGEGICQIRFYQGRACNVSYGDRKGKYQGQTEVTIAKV